MDVSSPYRAIAPTLDVSILVELSRHTEPISVPRLRERLGRGSDRGLRLALERLVRQGIVTEKRFGSLAVYALNEQHLAAPAVHSLADMRTRFLNQLRELIASWTIPPTHASLFGSAARRDGDASSDIDVLVVRPADVTEDDSAWRNQLDDLEARIYAWTGNATQLAEIAEDDVAELRRRRPPIVDELARDAIDLAGVPVRSLLQGAGS